MGIKAKKFLKVFVVFLWILFFVGVVSVATLFILISKGKVGYMPPIEELENPKNKFASVVYSADNVELGRFTEAKENRVFVNYNQLSPYLVQALVATEDARFAEHSGVDAKAIVRAVVKT